MKKKYYSWFVLFGITLIYFASNGYGYLSIPAFYPSLTDFLQVPKGVVPQTASILTLIIALLSPFIGYFLDKYNPKIILIIGVFLIASMQYFFTKIASLNDLKIFNAGYAIALSLGGFTTSMFILNKWFEKSRGIAVGIFLNASSLGAFLFSPFIGNQLKLGFSWQEVSTKMFYFSAFLLIIPLIWIKIRPSFAEKVNKEDFLQNNKITNFTNEISLKNAMKTTTFWSLIIVTGGLWFCINGLIFHKDSYLTDLNLDPKQRGNFSSIYFFCGVLGKLFFGFLSDKFPKKSMMILSIFTILLGTILLKFSLINPSILPVVAVVYGIGYSGSFTMIQLIIADFYSGKYYGSILGFFIMADTLFGAVGTYLLGSLRKTSGSYESSFLTMIFICIFALIGTFLLKKKDYYENSTR